MSEEGKDLRGGACCASSKHYVQYLVEQQPMVTPCPEVVAHLVHLTFPPGDIGAPPHTHPGPVVGYVLEGEFLFQMNGEPRRILKAGEAFYERYGDIHVWSANASDITICKVVSTVFGIPGEPVSTDVEGHPRESRREALELARQGK